MKYDFDRIIDRQHTNALKMDGFRGYIFHAGPEKVFPYKDDEFVHMWVADMEFGCAPEILDAIHARVDREIFGYTMMFGDEYYKAFLNWCESRYGWSFPQEQLCLSPGIVPAVDQLLADLTADGSRALLNTPAYSQFQVGADKCGAELVYSKLYLDDGDFKIDFEDMAAKAADPAVKVLIWCNPHNPTGRVWTEEELKRVAEIVEQNDLWIISDEIHCDLVRTGVSHTPMAKVMPDYPKLVTCMSASKTFNMAGLLFSNVIIRDPELRERFLNSPNALGMLNPLSVAAHQAAYEHGGAWLEELKAYLDENFRFTKEYLAENLPEVAFEIPESTYLAWVDMTPALPDVSDLADFFANKAGVLLESGNNLFVDNAEGFVRLNLAMPKSMLATGLERMCDAITAHRA